MRIFDIINLIALLMISIGTGFKFGWETGVITGGALLMALNFRIYKLMRMPR